MIELAIVLGALILLFAALIAVWANMKIIQGETSINPNGMRLASQPRKFSSDSIRIGDSLTSRDGSCSGTVTDIDYQNQFCLLQQKHNQIVLPLIQVDLNTIVRD
jgi:hypothetical protein